MDTVKDICDTVSYAGGLIAGWFVLGAIVAVLFGQITHDRDDRP